MTNLLKAPTTVSAALGPTAKNWLWRYVHAISVQSHSQLMPSHRHVQRPIGQQTHDTQLRAVEGLSTPVARLNRPFHWISI